MVDWEQHDSRFGRLHFMVVDNNGRVKKKKDGRFCF